MRARVDTDENLNPWQVVEKAYTDDFLGDLAKRFGFDLGDDEAVRAIKQAGARYVLARRLEDTNNLLRDERDEYRRLAEAIELFEKELTRLQEIVVPDMFHAAFEMHELKPATDFPHLTEHEKKRGEPYYFELLRMLEILKTAVGGQIDGLTSKGGRPRNEGLALFMLYAADFWAGDLGRRFSIDHHQGAGLTEAFEFAKYLLAPLDNVTDAQIVTAMRRHIRERRTLNIPT